MPVVVRCPNQSCGQPLRLPDITSATQSCPHCGQAFRIAAPAAATQSLPPDTAATGTPALKGAGKAPAPAALDLPAADTTKPATGGRGEPVDAGVTRSLPPEASQAPPGPAPLPHVPERIGRFVIRRFLGEGAFGRVYEAYDAQLDRAVALKVAKPELIQSEQRVKRFLREAKSAANLRHPHIVPVFDSGSDAGHFYIASAFIPGRSLDKHLEELPGGQVEDFRTSVQVVRRLAEALAYAHQRKVVHRDVKPANVMLDELGEPLLMDFGLAAREESGEKLTQEGVKGMGTPAYMAPEQGAGEAVAASDQYSLGCTLYELLTGQTPFAGPPELQMFLHQSQEPVRPRKVNGKVPLDLDTICMKCLEKEPAKRYPDCQALADDLRRWLDGESITARRVGLVERTAKWARRSPITAGLSAALGLLLLTAAAGGTVLAAWALREASRADDRAAAAEIAEGQAKKERIQAEANLDEAERQRKLYEESFRQARAAVDDFIHTSEGELFNKPGLEEARRKMFEIALKYHQELVKQRGSDPALQRELAHFYEHIGNLLGPTEQRESLAFHEKALQIREQLSLARPQDVDLQADCASSYHNIGGQKDKSGNQEESLNYYQKAVAILDRLVQDHPRQSKFQINLGKAYNNIANVHHKSNRADEAVIYYQKSIKLQESLTESDPDDIELKLGLAQSYNNLGILQGQTSQFSDAYLTYTKTKKLYEELAKTHPENYVFQNGRAMACRGMGLALAKQERREEAIGAFQQAIRHQRVALGLTPAKGQDAAQYRTYLGTHCRLLADVLREAGRPADAVTVLLEQRTLSVGQPDKLVQVAEGLALCAPLVGTDKDNLTDGENKQRTMYLGLAMETLQWAVGAGYKEVELLKSSPAFELLRSRPEFQKLLAELGK